MLATMIKINHARPTNKINYCKQQDQQGADQKTDNSKEE
jgi:hypothetical protein